MYHFNTFILIYGLDIIKSLIDFSLCCHRVVLKSDCDCYVTLSNIMSLAHS